MALKAKHSRPNYAQTRLRIFEQVERVCAEQRRRVLYNLHVSSERTWRALREMHHSTDNEILEGLHRTMRLGTALHWSEDDPEMEIHDWRQ